MKAFLVCFLSISLFAGLSAQKTETRTISSFDKLDVFGNVIVELTKGTQEKLEVESQEIELNKITTKMDGRTLKISMSKDIYAAGKTVRILITYVQIYEIYSRGGADVKAEAPLTADRLVFEASTGGNIYVDVDTKTLQASVGQGSLIVSAGKTVNQEIEVNSGGVFSAFDLDCQETLVKANSKGRAKINTTKSLTATASTGGWVGFKGNPPIRDTKTNFGGTVEVATGEE
jgi:hypothetical protein